MVRNQFSWRRSNGYSSIFLLTLLLTPISLVAMEYSDLSVPSEEEKYIPIEQRVNNESSIEGVNFIDIDQVWKKTPTTVKNWAKELKEQKGKLKSLPYRLFLYGIPGTGKTTMGLGIWRENPDWQLVKISAGDLISKHRGAAAQQLREKLKQIKSEIKTIVFIDEAHVLMERHSQESTDTSETTETMKAYLDKEAQNRNIMIILTGNQVKDMKESMKSRLFRCGVKVNPPTNEELHEMFYFYTESEELNTSSITNKEL